MTGPGLCGACRHGRAIRSARGSTFWLCRRAATDRRFARYPALPVLACPGFEDGPEAPEIPPNGGSVETTRGARPDPRSA